MISLCGYACVNKLALNVRKTKYMIFHYRQRDIHVRNFIPSLKIKNEPIERVTEFNFLGLTIDKTLGWHPHVLKIANKMFRILGIMGRLKILNHKYLEINVQLFGSSPLTVRHSGLGFQNGQADWRSYKNALCALSITCQNVMYMQIVYSRNSVYFN